MTAHEVINTYVIGVHLGEHVEMGTLTPLLSDEKIFGVNLYDVNMADTVVGYFNEMIAGKGAVRATLKKYVK